jgi:hypothetical protein
VSDKKPKGIVDPWRKVEPLRPAPQVVTPSRKRINLDEVDRDADLAIPGKQVLRFMHACFDVTSTRVQTASDALDVLADCIADLFSIHDISAMLTAAGIGVRCKDRMFNVPSEEESASTLKNATSCFWFVQKPLDQGVLVLARILRSPYAAPTLHRHGVTVMMTAS